MSTLPIPEIMRMVERIIVVFGGILSIYLGYLLFHLAHLKSESGGKFKTDVFEFTVSKVGPGVFFALFGAYVLYASLSHSISTTETTNAPVIAFDPDLSKFLMPDVSKLTSNSDETKHDEALAELAKLIQKLPSPEDQAAGKKALQNLRTVVGSWRGFYGWRSLLWWACGVVRDYGETSKQGKPGRRP